MIATPAPAPTKHPPPSRPGQVTGKLRDAINLMVYEGLAMDEAAKAVGVPTRRIRLALEKRHVLSYMRGQRQVLRASMSGKNILALAEVRDQRDNQMARVQAVKALEQLDDDEQSVAAKAQAPGFVIQIVTPGDVAVRAVPHRETLELEHHDAKRPMKSAQGTPFGGERP